MDILPSYYESLERLKRPHLRPVFDKLLSKIEAGHPSAAKPIRSFNMKHHIDEQLFEASSNLDGGYRIYWKKKTNSPSARPVVMLCGMKKTQVADIETAFDMILNG
jgi:putative component of toxin-antitoxin plasmid stabilization module